MSQDSRPRPLPAPCIIDYGTVINKDDMRRLLIDLGKVRYIHILDGYTQSEGEGWVVEVFTDTQQATLVANGSLYLNVQSFDYLILNSSPEQECYFDLMQDNRQLRLIPLECSDNDKNSAPSWDARSLEEMVAQVLSAQWDVQLDDDCPF
jgi:hypothetical protein